MCFPHAMRGAALLCLLLIACASSASAVQGDEEPREAVVSWEEAREDASCVVPLCEEERCALWRCRELELADPPSILLTRGTLTLRPPASPTRWWGRPLVAPFDSDPVFEIPWHDRKIRDQYAPHALRLPCIPSHEPFEKHHIFPQEPLLAGWFKRRNIDITPSPSGSPGAFIPGCTAAVPEAVSGTMRGDNFEKSTPTPIK